MRLIVAIAAAAAALSLIACGSSKSCDSSSCTGCCDANGVCQVPSASACGAPGASCQTCSAGQTCQTGVCAFGGTSSGNGGGATSTTSGSGGTTSSSGTTAGGSSTSGSSGTTGASDTRAPSILSASLITASVDVTNGAQVATVSLHATDDVSGVASGDVSLELPGGYLLSGTFDASARTQGTALDGEYAVQIPVPQYMPPGSYPALSMQVADAAGNVSQYLNATLEPLQVTLQVVDAAPDTTGPMLVSASVSPTVVNVSSGTAQTVTMTVRIRDDLSGVDPSAGMTAHFTAGGGTRELTGDFSAADRISGDALDGVYRFDVPVPTSTLPDTYVLSSVQVSDAVWNFGGSTSTLSNVPTISVQ